MGAKTTKTLVREEANFGEFQELTSTMRKSSIRAAVLSALFYAHRHVAGRDRHGVRAVEGRRRSCSRAWAG